MRPGHPADLPAVIELWRAGVRSGSRNSMPPRSRIEALASRFDWGVKSRVIESGKGQLAGVVMVASSTSPDGALAHLDVAATTDGMARELAGWGLALSRASGAIAAIIWVSRGHGEHLREVGLELARPWWRMDRSLETELPEPHAINGYQLIDGSAVTPGSWADVHGQSFADHWRFSYRTDDELVGGSTPELCLMAVSAVDREPAAFTMCEVESLEPDSRPQPIGLVKTVGTISRHRRRGLATWLVAEGMARLRTAGARHASLYVDGQNQTHAYDAYSKLGFQVAFEAEVWEASFS
jgi:ribosomal protein S18 acetylase RimI-like enzyme